METRMTGGNLDMHKQGLNSLQLTKSSTHEQIKAYFTQVFNLKNSGEEFPVDFDAVWPLLYAAKNKAVNELTKTKDEFGNLRYMKDFDYQTLNQKVQAGKHNKTVKHVYKLSVEGMEWFIARKVRPVFEVYRQVFHKTVEAALSFDDKSYITMPQFCEQYGKTQYGFYGLIPHYKMEFAFLRGQWHVSTDLCKMVEMKTTFASTRQKLRERNDPNQLQMNFKDGGQA